MVSSFLAFFKYSHAFSRSLTQYRVILSDFFVILLSSLSYSNVFSRNSNVPFDFSHVIPTEPHVVSRISTSAHLYSPNLPYSHASSLFLRSPAFSHIVLRIATCSPECSRLLVYHRVVLPVFANSHEISHCPTYSCVFILLREFSRVPTSPRVLPYSREFSRTLT